MINEDNKPLKFLGSNKNKCGIYCHSDFGPNFRGKDNSDDEENRAVDWNDDEADNAKVGSDNVLGNSDSHVKHDIQMCRYFYITPSSSLIIKPGLNCLFTK